MRILILQDYLRCGGTERQSVALARMLHDEGSDTFLLTFRPGGRLEAEAADAGVPFDALQFTDTGLNFFAPRLVRAIRKFGPDVILCMGRMANCYGGLIQHRFPRVAVVGTVRTGKPLPALYRWSLRQVSGVLTNTDWWQARLIEFGVDPGKILVIANGLTRDWSGVQRHGAREAMRESLSLRPSSVVFLNVAEFRPGKRQARLIEFFSGLDSAWDWHLWLVGEGKEWDRCRTLAERDGRGRIHLFGHSENPLPWYAAADVAVSHSVEDSLPNFLVEAQTLRLPVIASDYQGIAEAFRDGKTGYLVGANDTEGLHDAVRRLYLDPLTRHEMGRQAEAFAAGRFASRPHGSNTLDALRSFFVQHRTRSERLAG